MITNKYLNFVHKKEMRNMDLNTYLAKSKNI